MHGYDSAGVMGTYCAGYDDHLDDIEFKEPSPIMQVEEATELPSMMCDDSCGKGKKKLADNKPRANVTMTGTWPKLNVSDVPYNLKHENSHAEAWVSSATPPQEPTELYHGSIRETLGISYHPQPTSFSIDEKVDMLRFAFQDIDYGILEDVLIAKDYDLARTAQALSKLVSENHEETGEFMLVPVESGDSFILELGSQWKHQKTDSEWVVLSKDVLQENDAEEKARTKDPDFGKQSLMDASSWSDSFASCLDGLWKMKTFASNPLLYQGTYNR